MKNRKKGKDGRGLSRQLVGGNILSENNWMKDAFVAMSRLCGRLRVRLFND